MSPESPSLVRRALAAAVVAAALLAYAPPRAAVAAPSHCDHPATAGLAWSAATAMGDCHVGTAASCAAMPQCGGTVPAPAVLRLSGVPDVPPAGPAAGAAAALHGRMALGPPTPPPNS